MRVADVEVGGEYAYRAHKYMPAVHVVVESTRVEREGRRDGVRVRRKDGERFEARGPEWWLHEEAKRVVSIVVPARQLTRTWAEEEAAEAAAARRLEEDARKRLRLEEKRARIVGLVLPRADGNYDRLDSDLRRVTETSLDLILAALSGGTS